MSEITEQVANLIVATRKAKGMSQKELAEKIGIDATTLNRFESGNQNLTIQSLQRIAGALGLKLTVGFE